jgi:hypothetical protein
MEHWPDGETAVAAAWEAARMQAEAHRLIVTFERIVVVGAAAAASFLSDDGTRVIVSLERARRWEWLGARVIDERTRRHRSLRPSEYERGRWIAGAAGVAPPRATTALIAFAGRQERVPVVNGLYLFAASLTDDPGDAPELRGFE